MRQKIKNKTGYIKDTQVNEYINNQYISQIKRRARAFDEAIQSTGTSKSNNRIIDWRRIRSTIDQQA